MNTRKSTSQSLGFTIVELLIVVVVIGILAAIIIIAFNGIQGRAAETSLKSDLNQASRILAATKVTEGDYPSATGSDGSAEGLKASGDNKLQYTSDGAAYCLTGTTGYKVPAFMITHDNTSPREGVCPGHIGAVGDEESSSPVTALSCFEMSGSSLRSYYDNEDNNVANPACPRDVVIPSSVTFIVGSAFRTDGLTSVTIPDTVTSIGSYAFASNNLTSVTIPDTVTSIGSYAFAWNYNLTSVSLPDSITSIKDYAFHYNDLTSLTIPSSVTSIGSNAFNGSNLTSLTIPDSVTSIGAYAFNNNNLTSVTIPDSVTSIEKFTFAYNKLTSLTIPSSVTSIAEHAFRTNNLTTVTIPDSVINIGSYAFGWNYDLSSVSLPAATTLGTNVFDSGVTITRR